MIRKSLLKIGFTFARPAHDVVVAQQCVKLNSVLPAELEVPVDAFPFCIPIAEGNDIAEDEQCLWSGFDDVFEDQAGCFPVVISPKKNIFHPKRCLSVADE